MSIFKVYSFLQIVKAKLFTLMLASDFFAMGHKTSIYPPLRVNAPDRIRIGSGSFIGPNSWLNCIIHVSYDILPNDCLISIADRVSIVGSFVASAAKKIVIEDDVLIARNVYISDHSHCYENINIPIKDQGINKIAPVTVKNGAWLGQNCVIGPGVCIGRGAVVGANSFVNRDVPDFTVVAGSPAKIVKTFG